MKQDSPEFKVAVVEVYNRVKKNIQDEIMGDPDSDKNSRFRKALILLNDEILTNPSKNNFPLRDVYEEVLEMISVDLKRGYGVPVISLEIFDHQARDWLLLKLEQFSTGEHSWCSRLKENPENIAVLAFCYGSIKGTPTEASDKDPASTEVALLPTILCQLINYDDEEGKILEIDTWDLLRNGVLIQPDILKQFGR